MSDVDAPVLACRPNINARGRRMRTRVGYIQFTVAALFLIAGVAFGLPAWARALVFFPAALGAIGLLQARRNT